MANEDLVKLGAQVRMAELQKEMGRLEALLGRGPRPGRQPASQLTVKSTRKPMSAARKHALSLKLKAVWAEKKKREAKKK